MKASWFCFVKSKEFSPSHMRSPPEVSTPPGNSWTAAEKSSTEQAVKVPAFMSTVFTKLGRGVLNQHCWYKPQSSNIKRGSLQRNIVITWARTPLVQWQCKVESEPHVDCLSPTLRSPACFFRQRSLSRKTWDQDWSFTDLEIFVTWAPEPSDCPRRPSKCQPGGLNETRTTPGEERADWLFVAIGGIFTTMILPTW